MKERAPVDGQLIERLISPPTDPLLCRRAALAGLVVRLGIALLRQLRAPVGPQPGRDLARSSSLRRFRRGDRLCAGTEEFSTDPTVAAVERAAVIVETGWEELRGLVRELSPMGQKKALRLDLRSFLAPASPARRDDLAQAAVRPPRRAAPRPDHRAERNTARLIKLLERLLRGWA